MNVFKVVIHIPIIFCYPLLSLAMMCPFNTLTNGNKFSKATLTLHKCTGETMEANVACIKKPISVLHLERGEVTDLNYDVNSYKVTAVLRGDDVCVSFRRLESRVGIEGATEQVCELECGIYMNQMTSVMYHRELNCPSGQCNGIEQVLKISLKTYNTSLMNPVKATTRVVSNVASREVLHFYAMAFLSIPFLAIIV